MSNINNKQPKVVYQLEANELERIITHAIDNAMERFAPIITPAQSTSADLMTREEVCSLLHVTKATLNNWDRAKYLTKVKVGRRVLYRRSDVEALADRTNKTNK